MSRGSASPVRACSRRRKSSSLGRGNFGASPKPPRRASKAARNCWLATVEHIRSWRPPRRRSGHPKLCSRSTMDEADRSTLSRSSRQTRAISSRMSTKPGLAPSRRRRKVRAAVERLQRRREPHAHRPPSRAGRGLHERHVHAIDVRPLLAIDLDRDEMAIEDLRHLGVLEALVLHHVAPVAGRVADRQEDRLVLAARPLEGVVAPRIPVNRIVLVLKEVRTMFSREAIGHALVY